MLLSRNATIVARSLLQIDWPCSASLEVKRSSECCHQAIMCMELSGLCADSVVYFPGLKQSTTLVSVTEFNCTFINVAIFEREDIRSYTLNLAIWPI